MRLSEIRSMVLLFLCLGIYYSVYSQVSAWTCAVVTEKGETINCKNFFVKSNGKVRLDKIGGRKIPLKDIKMAVNNFASTYYRVPVDPDKPNGKMELRAAKVPKPVYSNPLRIGVVISLYKSQTMTSKDLMGDHNNVSTTTFVEFKKKPDCFEFIKKQIKKDMEALQLKPVFIIDNSLENEYATESISSKAMKSYREKGADVVFHFEFHSSPSNGKAREGKVSPEDFKRGRLTIVSPKGEDYSSEPSVVYSNFDGKDRPGYHKLWKKFLADYQRWKNEKEESEK